MEMGRHVLSFLSEYLGLSGAFRARPVQRQIITAMRALPIDLGQSLAPIISLYWRFPVRPADTELRPTQTHPLFSAGGMSWRRQPAVGPGKS